MRIICDVGTPYVASERFVKDAARMFTFGRVCAITQKNQAGTISLPPRKKCRVRCRQRSAKTVRGLRTEAMRARALPPQRTCFYALSPLRIRLPVTASVCPTALCALMSSALMSSALSAPALICPDTLICPDAGRPMRRTRDSEPRTQVRPQDCVGRYDRARPTPCRGRSGRAYVLLPEPYDRAYRPTT